jgi:adenylate cyclase class 2
MSVEIEAKLKVDSIEQVQDRLKELGADFIAEQSQKDVLFDDTNDTMQKADSCLRLREQVTGDGSKYILAFKGAKEQSNFKKRPEVEVEIMDADSASKFLSALGYKPKLSVEKKRRLWKLGGCEVALDRLNELGDFVEIEGPDDDKIIEVQKSLGLEDVPHIPKSYASMIMETLNQSGKKQK